MKIILQVDDDANDVFLLQHAMKKVGLTNPVQVVSDGQEAIDYLNGSGKFADREEFPYPALLLMDLKLPYVMGLDVLRWIRAQSRTPLMIVMLTASAEQADITEAYRLGANAFLTKPSEASKLEDMVRAIQAFWLTHNTPPPEPSPESSRPRRFSLALSGEPPPFAEADGMRDNRHNGTGFLRRPLTEPLSPERKPPGPPVEFRAQALTRRQTEVMQLIAQGYSTREIASRFSVSPKTIEKHRQAVMDKLDIHEVATLTRYAVSKGLVECRLGPRNGATAMAHWQPREAPTDLGRDSDKTS